MIYSQFTLPALAVCATMMATYRGVEVAQDIITPPAIEGSAFYDEPIPAGGTAVIPWVISKRTGCPGYSSRVWNGEDGFFLSEPVQATAIPIVEEKLFRIPTRVPDLTPAGAVTLTIRGHFQCDGEGKRFFEIGPVNLSVEG